MSFYSNLLQTLGITNRQLCVCHVGSSSCCSTTVLCCSHSCCCFVFFSRFFFGCSLCVRFFFVEFFPAFVFTHQLLLFSFALSLFPTHFFKTQETYIQIHSFMLSAAAALLRYFLVFFFSYGVNGLNHISILNLCCADYVIL